LTLFERFNVRYSNPFGQHAIAAYVALARKYELAPAQMALAYVSSRPFVTSAITGVTQLEQLQSNIASLDVTLSHELLQEIEQLHQQYPNPCP
jgi:aryl-alcohol dehydrogenase-like predicted oxidoreductase